MCWRGRFVWGLLLQRLYRWWQKLTGDFLSSYGWLETPEISANSMSMALNDSSCLPSSTRTVWCRYPIRYSAITRSLDILRVIQSTAFLSYPYSYLCCFGTSQLYISRDSLRIFAGVCQDCFSIPSARSLLQTTLTPTLYSNPQRTDIYLKIDLGIMATPPLHW